MFEKARKHLIDDLDTPCYICGSKENRQVHHNILEASLANAVDWNKVKLAHPDFPDWNKIDPNNPETFVYFVDSEWQMRVYCIDHHIGTNKNGKGYGVHALPWPLFVFQKYVKDDYKLFPDSLVTKDINDPEYVDDLS